MLGVQRQGPDDVLDYDIDFSKWLESGTITSAVAGADTGIVAGPIQLNSPLVKVWVSGGEAGQSYRIRVTATAGSRVKEVCFEMRIKDC